MVSRYFTYKFDKLLLKNGLSQLSVTERALSVN